MSSCCALAWGRKMEGIPQENEGFWSFMGLTFLAPAQNLSLDETSVWRSKIIEIPEETEGF